MFVPNIDCTINKLIGTDAYGQEQFGTSIRERCAIVKLKSVKDRTTVRADSSASRGHAWEWISESKILLRSTTAAEVGDKIIIFGMPVRILSSFPRHSVTGKLDHYEVTGEYIGRK